jgi:hypothetical protein
MDRIIIPSNLDAFKILVLGKVKTYCKAGIWPWRFDVFAAWLSNFDAGEDEYIALQLIDSLIVRSEGMAIAAFSKLLTTDLLEYLIERNVVSPKMDIRAWRKQLKDGRCTNIQFLPIRLDGDEGESGGAIFRQLSTLINTNKLSRDRGNIEAVILIDDFLGSGSQLNEFISSAKPQIINCNNVVYCPLMATSYGLSNTSKDQPGIKVIPAEIISEDQSLFPPNCDDDYFKNDRENKVITVRKHYDNMKEKYASRGMMYWDGRDEKYLPIAFEWGCPNQTPAIFWMEHTPKSSSWQQLFCRRA